MMKQKPCYSALDSTKHNLFQVPEGVSVRVDEKGSQKILGNLDKTGDEVTVAIGGTGGGPSNSWLGQRGQSQHIRLDLRVS